jgi:RimJ/RimL family protein N-acetyltransferase
MRNPYLVGETIYFRPFDATADAPVTVAWFNDPAVTRFMRRYLPMTPGEQEEFLRSMKGSTTNVALGMVRKSDDQLIGAAGLHEIDHRSRNAWFGITIGEKSAWGKGHGTEATRLILELAFERLNFNRVYLYVYEYNERARHVYEKVGFRVEGRLRQDMFVDGRYWDTIVMGILRDEWLAGRS